MLHGVQRHYGGRRVGGGKRARLSSKTERKSRTKTTEVPCRRTWCAKLPKRLALIERRSFEVSGDNYLTLVAGGSKPYRETSCVRISTSNFNFRSLGWPACLRRSPPPARPRQLRFRTSVPSTSAPPPWCRVRGTPLRQPRPIWQTMEPDSYRKPSGGRRRGDDGRGTPPLRHGLKLGRRERAGNYLKTGRRVGHPHAHGSVDGLGALRPPFDWFGSQADGFRSRRFYRMPIP